MRIFFNNSETGEAVPSAVPVDVTLAEVLMLWAKLISPRSFLGIILSDSMVLQLYLEADGGIYLEILDRERRTTLGANVNTPIAEAAIEAAFTGRDIYNELQQFFLVWTKDSLP